MNFKKIILYKEPAISEINIEKIKKFIENNFPFKVEIKENIFKEFSLKNIKELSDIRITDIKNSFLKCTPSDTEIEFEEKLCSCLLYTSPSPRDPE